MTNETDPRATEIRAILDTVDVDDGGWNPPGEPGDWYPFSPNVPDAEKDRITRDIIAAIKEK